jgi:branched-chain amino acid transport system substrate-binding protein
MPAIRPPRSTVFRLVALLFALVMVAAACGNSGDDEGSSTTTAASNGGSGEGGEGGEGSGGEGTSGELDVGDGPHGEFQPIEGVPGVTDDEIRVALLSTGEANPIGYCLLQCQADGIQAYFDWRNSQGGIHGRQLVLDVIDDEFANNQVRALEIIDKGEHFAVIGSPIMGTGFLDLVEAGVPVFASAVQSDMADGVTNMFTPVGTTCIRCPAKRNIWPVKDAGASKVGILGFGVAQASKDCVAGQKASFDTWGGPLGIEAAYVNDELPFGLPNGVGPEVSAMKRAGVDFIMTCMDQNSVLVLEQELERQGMGDVPLVLPNAYGDQEYLTANADLLEGDYIGLMYRPLEANQEGTDLEALVEHMDANGSAITDWAIISWINADQLFRGLLAAGPQFDQQKVVDAINSFTAVTHGGLTNAIDWTRQHDAVTPEDLVTNAPEKECFAYVIVKDGKAVLAGDPDKPHFCWDPAEEGWEEPEPTSFAAS